MVLGIGKLPTTKVRKKKRQKKRNKKTDLMLNSDSSE